ncbi:hypothetical protein ACJX0J_013811, partial [Zea mays]
MPLHCTNLHPLFLTAMCTLRPLFCIQHTVPEKRMCFFTAVALLPVIPTAAAIDNS